MDLRLTVAYCSSVPCCFTVLHPQPPFIRLLQDSSHSDDGLSTCWPSDILTSRLLHLMCFSFQQIRFVLHRILVHYTHSGALSIGSIMVALSPLIPILSWLLK